MRKITSTQKKASLMIIINVFVFSLCFIVFKDIKTKSTAISEITNQLDQQTKKESQYLSIQDAIIKTEQDREKVNSFFIESEGEVDFIELIESEGRASGVVAEIISVQVKDNSSTVENLILEVEASGSWQSVYYFLSILENLPYALRLESGSIRKTGSSVKTEEGLWRADFVLKVLKIKK